MSEEITLREHLRRAGSVKSERKAAAARLNGLLGGKSGGRPIGSNVKPCDCGGPPHTSKCPVYQRTAQARARKRRKAEKQAD